MTKRQDIERSERVNIVDPLAVALLICCAAAPALASAPKPCVIQLYNGLGTPAGARVWGRVLEDDRQAPPSRGEPWYRTLRRNAAALESDEIPHARLILRVLGRDVSVTANEEGLFEAPIRGPLPAGRHPIRAQLLGGRRFRVAPARLLVYPRGPGVVVISDIDDTVLQTGVERKLRMGLRVLMTSPYDLRSYPGAAALYQGWARRGYPLVFVSGSPVNLYPKLETFLALQKFPPAPLLLKDFGLRDLTEQWAYKLAHIDRVLSLLPGYRLLLVGDSGEQDPEVYAEVARRHPERVVAVLIHRVGTSTQGVRPGQIWFRSYGELARKLRRHAILGPAAVAGGEGAR